MQIAIQLNKPYTILGIMTSKDISNAFFRGFIKTAILSGALAANSATAHQPMHLLSIPPRVIYSEWDKETGKSNNWGIKGDHGKALGPLQIHLDAYKDATNFDSSLANHPYSYVTNLPYASKVYKVYQNEYNKPSLKALAKNPTNQAAIRNLAALWHGGPDGRHTQATVKYVADFMKKYLKNK